MFRYRREIAIYVMEGNQPSQPLSQLSRSMVRPSIDSIASLTRLDLTGTNVVCGATTLPSIGAHFVVPVHYLGHLSNTDVGQLHWLTCERCCMCQQLTIWLNLTIVIFFRLGTYWVNTTKPIHNIGVSSFTRPRNQLFRSLIIVNPYTTFTAMFLIHAYGTPVNR